MIWLVFALASAACLAPLMLALLRRHFAARGRREAALALYRAQLGELEREHEEGRIEAREFAAAQLEVQRRLLAAAAEAEPGTAPAVRRPILIALMLVPVAAIALYLPGGLPFLPAAPLAPRLAETHQADALIGVLRARLATMDPASPRRREGFILLGNAESERGDAAAAAQAWQTALASGFDPTLAAETAEAMSEAAGHVTPDAAALFKQALATAPPNAPWRGLARQRLDEAGM